MSHQHANRESTRHALRLLHASDLHLEQPPYGVCEFPEHLHDRLLDSAYDAATALFQLAISEKVDGLILAGDVVDLPLAGPRAIVFLREQFEKLHAQGIPVFWAGGTVDPPEAWPAGVSLPANVHVFPKGRAEAFDISRGGSAVAQVVGISRGAADAVPLDRLLRDEGDRFTIGVAHGEFAGNEMTRQRVDYLALGGRHHRKTYASATRMAHFPGSLQGRCPAETGPRGASLVHVDETGETKTQSVSLETIRWHTERMRVEPQMTLESILTAMQTKTKSLLAKSNSSDLLIIWQLEGTGQALHAIRNAEAAEDMLVRLREDFGHKSPCAWTLEVTSEIARPLPPDWFEQETILGDVLREIDEMTQDPSQPLALIDYLAKEDRDGDLAAVAHLPDTPSRERLLKQTADLCVDLLTVEEQHEALARRQSR